MEMTVVFRGTLSVSALSGGWPGTSVARRNLCWTVSLGCHKSKVQRELSTFVKRSSGAGSCISSIQFVRSGGGLTDDMAALMRAGNLDSFKYQNFSQRFHTSQESTSCLRSGNNIRYPGFLVSSRRTVLAQFHSFSSGPVLFSLAVRFHAASVQEGKYICKTGQEEAAEQSQAIKSTNAYTEDTASRTEDETENEVAGGVASQINEAGESRTEYWVDRDVCGRIYISEQGINAQISSRGKAAFVYANWVKEDTRFSDLLVQTSPSFEGHAFPRLRLRYKPSLVQVEGGTQHLPVTDPTARAVPLSPAEWAKRLDGAKLIGRTKNAVSQGDPDQGNLSSSSGRQVVLLDVRNGYEWDVGHFKGAQRPNVDCFKSTAFGLSETEDVSDDPLADVDREKVDVMMYCTVTYTRQCYVPPKFYNSERTQEGGISENTPYEKSVDSSADETFAICLTCGDPLSSPRHRNCANVDCNQLYLSCDQCLPQYKGCCCYGCSLAPKLRPLMVSIQQYERWHKYRSPEPTLPKPADYVSRRAMKRRRRKERRKQSISGDASKGEEFELIVQNA